MAAKKKARRTTHRSTTGTKLYAKRDAKGRFEDIQTYKRAHAADLKRTAKDEAAAQPAAKVRKAVRQASRKVKAAVGKVIAGGRATGRRTAKKK